MFRQATTTHPLVRLFTISSRLSNNRIQKIPSVCFLAFGSVPLSKKKRKKKAKHKRRPRWTHETRGRLSVQDKCHGRDLRLHQRALGAVFWISTRIQFVAVILNSDWWAIGNASLEAPVSFGRPFNRWIWIRLAFGCHVFSRFLVAFYVSE